MPNNAGALTSLVLAPLFSSVSVGDRPSPGRPHPPQEVHALIEKIERLPQFSSQAVAEFFGVSLNPAAILPDPTSLHARLSGGPFAHVAWREQRPRGAAPSWRISVTLSREVGVAFDSIDRRFIGRRLYGATAGPYESVSTRTLDLPGALLHLTYGMTTRTLQEITFVREGSPERAAHEAGVARAKRQAEALVKLVERLEKLPEFTESDIEKLLGVDLLPKTGGPQAGSWEAIPQGGLLEKVQYFENGPSQGFPQRLLSFAVRTDLAVHQRFIDSTWIGEDHTVDKAASEPVSLTTIARKVGRLQLGFGIWNHQLRRVALLR